MNRGRAVVGLSLLCAFFACALAAQGASAAEAKETTAWTCMNVGKEKGSFTDAHCSKEVKVGEKKGEYEHEEFKGQTETGWNNESEKGTTVAASFKFTFEGKETLVKCNTLTAIGLLENLSIKETEFFFGGTVSGSFRECTVEKPEKCTAKEFLVKGEVSGQEQLGAGKNEMGIQFGSAGKTFVEIAFEGAECGLKGKTAKIVGTAIATPGGGLPSNAKYNDATYVFTKSMTEQTLKVGTEKVQFEATTTTFNETKGTRGNPLIFTTTF
jgi:hypothetical protein